MKSDSIGVNTATQTSSGFNWDASEKKDCSTQTVAGQYPPTWIRHILVTLDLCGVAYYVIYLQTCFRFSRHIQFKDEILRAFKHKLMLVLLSNVIIKSIFITDADGNVATVRRTAQVNKPKRMD